MNKQHKYKVGQRFRFKESFTKDNQTIYEIKEFYTEYGIDKVRFLNGQHDSVEHLDRYYDIIDNPDLIGYETIVDLPGIPKGSKSGPINTSDESASLSTDKFSIRFTKELLQDVKFFKPIYKSAIELSFSNNSAVLSKENGLVFSSKEKLTFNQVKLLVDMLKFNDVSMSGYTVEVEYSMIKVGCKSFTHDDLQLLERSINKLENV